MKILERIINAIAAVLLAAVLAIAVRFGSRQKVEQQSGGWTPLDFSDLEQDS